MTLDSHALTSSRGRAAHTCVGIVLAWCDGNHRSIGASTGRELVFHWANEMPKQPTCLLCRVNGWRLCDDDCKVARALLGRVRLAKCSRGVSGGNELVLENMHLLADLGGTLKLCMGWKGTVTLGTTIVRNTYKGHTLYYLILFIHSAQHRVCARISAVRTKKRFLIMGFLDSVSKGLTKVSDQVNQAATSAQLSAQSAYYAEQISSAKAQWGKDCFDAHVAGDTAKVQEITQAALVKVKALQEKKAAVDAKKKAEPAVSEKITATIPEGASAGSTFTAQLPNGENVTLTVPAGAQPGTQATFDIPVKAPTAVTTPAAAAAPATTGTPVVTAAVVTD